MSQGVQRLPQREGRHEHTDEVSTWPHNIDNLAKNGIKAVRAIESTKVREHKIVCSRL
jgi:hypothetical protein